jgi:hypothetical protein
MINKFIGSHIIFFSLVLKIFLIQFMLLFSYNTLFFLSTISWIDAFIQTKLESVSCLLPLFMWRAPQFFLRSMAFWLFLSGSPWGFSWFFLIRNFQGLKAGELIVGSYVTVLVGYIRLCLAYARLYSGE